MRTPKPVTDTTTRNQRDFFDLDDEEYYTMRKYLVLLFASLIDLNIKEFESAYYQALKMKTEKSGKTIMMPGEDRMAYLKRYASTMKLSLEDRKQVVELFRCMLGVE